MTNNTRKATKKKSPVAPAPQQVEVRPPPMLHRRWLACLLLRGESNDSVRQLLLNDNLPTPDATVLDSMRTSLGVPKGFKPMDMKHAPSRELLQKLGLEAVFDGAPEVARALELLRTPRPREILEAAIIVSVPSSAVVVMMAKLFHFTVDDNTIKLYAALFFDFEISTRVQLRLLMEERIRQGVLEIVPRIEPRELRRMVASDVRVAALSLPPSEFAWTFLLGRLGWTPPRRELSATIRKLESTAARQLGEALARGGRDDARRAVSYAAVLQRLRMINETVQTPMEKLNQQLQIKLTHDPTPMTTHDQLRETGEVSVDNMPPSKTIFDQHE
jgi:hypothetical protein